MGKLVEGRFKVVITPFLALLICVSLFFITIGSAYADDYEGGGGGSHNIDGDYPNMGTVWYGPTKDVDDKYCYGVVAYTRYSAAIFNLGLADGYNEYHWTNKKKAKLLANDNTFKTFANLFKTGKPELAPVGAGLFNNDFAFVSSWNTARDLYGETYCWSARYPLSLKEQARRYVIEILMEDDSSGGSGGGSAGTGGLESGVNPQNFTFTMDDYVSVFEDKTIKDGYAGIFYTSGRKFEKNKCEFVVNKNTAINNFINSNVGTGKYITAILWNNNSIYQDDSMTLNLYLSQDEPVLNDSTHVVSFTKVKYIQSDTSNVSRNGSNTLSISYSNSPSSSWGSDSFNLGSRPSYMIGSWIVGTGSGGGDEGGGEPDDDPEPPVEWPAPPTSVTTQPPDVPTPGDPTTPTPPTPTDPVDPNPWLPVPDEDVSITGTDFQALLDALNTHCIHLQNSIEHNVEQLWNLQSALINSETQTIRDDLNSLITWLGNDVIVTSFTDLKDYLKELFDWLKEQLNLDVSVEGGQYDDTSVIYWLKQIWSKLGNGISTRPVDPVTDTDGWWDWFSSLLGGLIGSLADIGLDKIGGLVDALDTIKDKFPFCIPWDIAALLGLLVSEPVTPVVEVPLMALSVSDGVQQVGTMVIDLESYNGVWDAVRWIERIAFCVYLATRTKDFLDLLGKIKG